MANSAAFSIEPAKATLCIDTPGVEHVTYANALDVTIDDTFRLHPEQESIVVGVGQKHNILPGGYLHYKGESYDIGGWYTQIKLSGTDLADLQIRSEASELTIAMWVDNQHESDPEVRIIREEKFDYEYWLHWVINYSCNLKCEYCQGTIDGDRSNWTNVIDLERLKSNFKEIDVPLQISFVGGGEPFLVPNLIETCEFLTKKHQIAFVTNLTIPNVKELVGRIDPAKVTYILASFHIEALEKQGLIERYIEHYTYLRENGFTIQAQAVAYPGILDKCRRYREEFSKAGLDLVFTPFNGEFEGRTYPFEYSKEELDEFGIDPSQIELSKTKGKLCNAGFNVAVIHPMGDIISCDPCKQWLGNIYDNFAFEYTLKRCAKESCHCPMYVHDQDLFDRALELTKNGKEKHIHKMWKGM